MANTRRIGKQNIHGSIATMLGRACFVAHVKRGEALLQGLDVCGEPEESQTGFMLLSS